MFIKSVAHSWFVACLAATFFTTGAATAQGASSQRDDREGLSFVAASDGMSASMGGRQHLELNAGEKHANRWYVILGSITGSHPGTVVGGFTIPLNYDAYTEFTLTVPNGGLIRNQLARLDGAGNATAEFFLPAGLATEFVGLTVTHAYVVISEATSSAAADTPAGIAAVSEPVSVTLEA